MKSAQREIDWLGWMAAVSLVPAVFLLCGYLVRYGPKRVQVKGAPVAHVESTTVEMAFGRICIWHETQTPVPAGVRAGWDFPGRVALGPPDVRRCGWEFDNHSLTAFLKTPGATLYLVAFPIWCVLWPFLVGPLLWVRRWRRQQRREWVGFAVNVIERRN